MQYVSRPNKLKKFLPSALDGNTPDIITKISPTPTPSVTQTPTVSAALIINDTSIAQD